MAILLFKIQNSKIKECLCNQNFHFIFIEPAVGTEAFLVLFGDNISNNLEEKRKLVALLHDLGAEGIVEYRGPNITTKQRVLTSLRGPIRILSEILKNLDTKLFFDSDTTLKTWSFETELFRSGLSRDTFLALKNGTSKLSLNQQQPDPATKQVDELCQKYQALFQETPKISQTPTSLTNQDIEIIKSEWQRYVQNYTKGTKKRFCEEFLRGKMKIKPVKQFNLELKKMKKQDFWIKLNKKK